MTLGRERQVPEQAFLLKPGQDVAMKGLTRQLETMQGRVPLNQCEWPGVGRVMNPDGI